MGLFTGDSDAQEQLRASRLLWDAHTRLARSLRRLGTML